VDRYAEEIVLHKRFKDKNVRGEWFLLDDDDVAYIASRSELKVQSNG
jgi:hypothetical protein